MRKIAFILALILAFSVTAYAGTENTASYILNKVQNPGVGSVGGEWVVLGLARGEITVPDGYFENYYDNVEKYVRQREGILHRKKYTEYSRVVLALTAIGKNPANVGGYNLISPLLDYEKNTWQGINGAIFALIALDSADYPTEGGIRQQYVNYILDNQTNSGGWSLDGYSSDIDTTAMAVCALSNYRDNERVESALINAANFISDVQLESGGFASGGVENCESTAQVIVALCELGINIKDDRFVKGGNTAVDCLMRYCLSDGSFCHIADDKSANQMATEQAFYALVALDRISKNKTSLYDMSDLSGLKENDKITGLDVYADRWYNDYITKIYKQRSFFLRNSYRRSDKP